MPTASFNKITLYEYPHSVLDHSLPCGEKLPLDFALQHSRDYPEVLSSTVPKELRTGEVRLNKIAGVGIDFTSSNILPVYPDGKPCAF